MADTHRPNKLVKDDDLPPPEPVIEVGVPPKPPKGLTKEQRVHWAEFCDACPYLAPHHGQFVHQVVKVRISVLRLEERVQETGYEDDGALRQWRAERESLMKLYVEAGMTPAAGRKAAKETPPAEEEDELASFMKRRAA